MGRRSPLLIVFQSRLKGKEMKGEGFDFARLVLACLGGRQRWCDDSWPMRQFAKFVQIVKRASMTIKG